jgi:hypothetical protein
MSIDRDLRHVGELMAIRMLLAECFAELARSQESSSAFIATARARLLRRMGAMDPVSADDNNVVQASGAACISAVLSQARQLAVARLPTKAPLRRRGRGRAERGASAR